MNLQKHFTKIITNLCLKMHFFQYSDFLSEWSIIKWKLTWKLYKQNGGEQKCCTANRLFSKRKWFGFETILRKKMVQVADHAHIKDDLDCRECSQGRWFRLQTMFRNKRVWAAEKKMLQTMMRKMVWAADHGQIIILHCKGFIHFLVL